MAKTREPNQESYNTWLKRIDRSAQGEYDRLKRRQNGRNGLYLVGAETPTPSLDAVESAMNARIKRVMTDLIRDLTCLTEAAQVTAKATMGNAEETDDIRRLLAAMYSGGVRLGELLQKIPAAEFRP